MMATPLFECLRRAWPAARMAALIRPYGRGVIEGGPWFDQVIPCRDQSPLDLWRTGRAIRDFAPDLAVILPGSLRSALTARLGGAGRIVGYRRGGRSPLLSDGPRPRRDARGGFLPVPMVDYYLHLGRWMGLEVPPHPRPRLYVSDELARFGETYLAGRGVREGDTVIGLNPGAKFGSSKCWPPGHFARLAELLQDRLAARLLLLAGPGEQAIAERIVAESRARIINTAADAIDLGRLKPLVRRCNVLVTNDTGPRHYATAFDVPCVVMMGPTHPGWTGSNLERTRILVKAPPCAPCHRERCPTDHRCMTEILPEEVLAATERLLEEFPRQR
ncbi:MAG: glycosyltransferase family 9 protein [Planctomycetes bacterium]|nr:glycosyltransferase family 9 protein [Planctomycetota bacterium]